MKAEAAINYAQPQQTILIQTPIAVTTKSSHSKQAQAFVNWQWSTAGQTLWAQQGYRPVDASVAKQFASKFPTPADLFTIDPRKIVGLTIDPNRLVEIRRARVRTMGAARNRQYAELMEIYEELEEASKLHRRLGCPVIDISELSIEETAHRVLRVLEERLSAA